MQDGGKEWGTDLQAKEPQGPPANYKARRRPGQTPSQLLSCRGTGPTNSSISGLQPPAQSENTKFCHVRPGLWRLWQT